MTLIDELELKILKLYMHTNSFQVKALKSYSKTDRRDRTHYHAAFVGGNMRLVNFLKFGHYPRYSLQLNTRATLTYSVMH